MGLCVALFATTSVGRVRADTLGPRRSLSLVLVAPVAFVLTGSVVLVLVVPLALACVLHLVRTERAQRAEAALLRGRPVVLELVARRLEFGAGVAEALNDLTDDQRARIGLDSAIRRIRSGERAADALEAEPGLVAAALLSTELSGARSGDGLVRLADRLRSTALDGDAARSQSGQQLASAAVMSIVPPLVSVLYALSDERAAHFYLRTVMGGIVVLSSLALSAASWRWMRYITRPIA